MLRSLVSGFGLNGSGVMTPGNQQGCEIIGSLEVFLRSSHIAGRDDQSYFSAVVVLGL